MARLPEVSGFEVQGIVGRGGFSVVYRAYQPSLNRVVALKVINPTVSADEEATRRFERECRAIGSLTGHHAVVTVHESGTTADGDAYLAMEYLEGGSLHDVLERHGALPWPDAVVAAIQVAEALEAAHEVGILHRDVKPANVMRDRFGRYKLGDFGIAGLAAGANTTLGATAATVAYASPEVLLGERASPAADVYGLGATLYALVEGTPAHAVATDESVVPMVMRVTSDPAPELSPGLAPEGLRRLVLELMAKDPSHRPDVRAVVARLKSLEASHLMDETIRRVPMVAPSDGGPDTDDVGPRPRLDADDRRPPEEPVPSTPAAADRDAGGRAGTGTAHGGTVAPSTTGAGDGAAAGWGLADAPTTVTPNRHRYGDLASKVESGRTEDRAVLPTDGEERSRPLTPSRQRRVLAAAIDAILVVAVVAGCYAVATWEPGPSTSIRVVYDGEVSVSPTRIEPGTPIEVTFANETNDIVYLALQSELTGINYPSSVISEGTRVAAGGDRSVTIDRVPEDQEFDIARLDSDGALIQRYGSPDGTLLSSDADVDTWSAPVAISVGVLLGLVVAALGWPALVIAVGVVATYGIPGATVACALLVLAIEPGARLASRASVGERSAGVRVVDEAGRPASAEQVLWRWLLRPLSVLPLAAGYWMPRRAADSRPWHDRWSGTRFERVGDRRRG
ncbi:MAG: protein kinase [Acidimicrobiales bacterium]|nr:protein kinase [Acidimicrobiales bacterium]